jgi:hypothetical protein
MLMDLAFPIQWTSCTKQSLGQRGRRFGVLDFSKLEECDQGWCARMVTISKPQ